MVTLDHRRHPPDPRLERFIYAFWHESLLAPTKMRTAVKVLVSQSADGELISQACHHMGIGTIRGSSSRGGAQGLLGLLRDCLDSHLAITPDGPRGPRRKLQPGVIFVASHTGVAIVPVGVGYTHAWRAGSWDRFALPCPGSVMTGVIGSPIVIPPQVSDEDLQRHRRQVEEAMLNVTAAAEGWAEELATGRRRLSALPTPQELEQRLARTPDARVGPKGPVAHATRQYSQT